MPLGFAKGPASFTQLINLAISGRSYTHCLVYLDGIIIWAPTYIEDHVYRLQLPNKSCWFEAKFPVPEE